MPQSEEQPGGLGGVVIDGHEEQASVGAGFVLHRTDTHAASVLVEHAHYVACIGDERVAHIDLCHNVHGVALHVLRYGPFGLLSLYGQFQIHGVCHVFFVGEVDNLVVEARLQILADGEGDFVITLWIDHIAHFIDSEPVGQILNPVGMSLAAFIQDSGFNIEVLSGLYGQLAFLAEQVPVQRIAVHVEALRDGRSHEVAVLVGYAVQRDIDVALVDAGVLLVDVHHELVVASHEAEVELAQFLVCLDRSAYSGIDVRQDFAHRIDKHAVALAGVVAVVVALHHLAQGVGLQGKSADLLLFLTGKVHIDQQSALFTAGRLRGIALDERCGQGLLEEGQSVDVARQGIVLQHFRLAFLLPHHVAEVEACADHAAQRVGGKLCLRFIVNIDGGHVARTVHGHGIVMPVVVAEDVA